MPSYRCLKSKTSTSCRKTTQVLKLRPLRCHPPREERRKTPNSHTSFTRRNTAEMETLWEKFTPSTRFGKTKQCADGDSQKRLTASSQTAPSLRKAGWSPLGPSDVQRVSNVKNKTTCERAGGAYATVGEGPLLLRERDGVYVTRDLPATPGDHHHRRR